MVQGGDLLNGRAEGLSLIYLFSFSLQNFHISELGVVTPLWYKQIDAVKDICPERRGLDTRRDH
jgi:hypothetical protein